MGNFDWGINLKDDRPLNIVLFTARNKDNKHLEGFKERRKAFLTCEPMYSEELKKEFENFVAGGVKGEMSRFYYSVNERDKGKVYKELLHYLIDNPDFNLASIQSKVAGIAAKKENKKTSKWMFDLDIDDSYAAWAVCQNIKLFAPDVEIEKHKTPHGYAIIVNHGFDTREVMSVWDQLTIDITLKRDDMLCFNWKVKK